MSRAITTTSNTFVYYDLAPLDSGQTRLSLMIVIQLPDRMTHWLALLTRSQAVWRQHLAEELLGEKREIEAASL